TDLHYEELVSSESSITEKEVEVPLDQKVINEMKVEEETHLLNNATDNSHIDSIEEIENVIEYQPPSINLPTPTLFKFELEYIPHLEIIPMPNRARATTRVVKKSFSTNVKDFIYGPGLTGIGVIMLMIFLLLFATSLELEGATLTIIFSVFGLIMMGIGHLFVEGKFIGLKSKEPGLGILIIIVGFLISVIMAFSTMMVNPIMIIIPVLFFVIGFYLGYRNDSNTLLTLVTITAIISPLLIAQNYHVNDGIFVKLLLFGGGLIFILPLSVFTYYLGNSEKSIYPAITLLLFGPTIGISSLALSISDLVPALGIIGSITPVSLLLMRGKIELITPYLKSLFAILFIWPVVVWISQSNISNNNQLSLSLYNSLIMFLGIALNLHLCTSMQYSERISELVKSITISMDKYVRILVPSIGFLVITFEIGGNIGGLTSYTSFFFNAIVPSILFIVSILVYFVISNSVNFSKPSKFAILYSLLLVEYAILGLGIRIDLLDLNDKYQILSQGFIISTIFISLLVGLILHFFPNYFHISGNANFIAGLVTLINAGFFIFFILSGNWAVIASFAGYFLFIIALKVPNIPDFERIRLNQQGLFGNIVILCGALLLYRFDNSTIILKGINYGSTLVYLSFVGVSSISMYIMRSKIVIGRVNAPTRNIEDYPNFVVRLLLKFEGKLLENQEVSYA
ncbi:MAG: hypothetical protein OEZ01_18155, partial [Candidatus Heimdallarchaeota archaeon]|nr:hypothetical protein [Candidatus Heimdallarchaeota archaeon]